MTNHLLNRSTSTYSHTQNLPFPSTSTSPSTTPRTKFLLILFTIAMATLFSISFLSLILSTSLSSATNHLHHRPSPNLHSNSPPPEIHRSCKATRYPATCTAHLSKHSANLPQNPTPTDIIQSTLSVSAQNLKTAQSMVQDILSTSSSNLNRSRAAQLCLEGFTNSARRTSDADSALSRGRLKDARAWTSAALSYQYDCWSGLGYVNGTSVVNQTMSFIDTQLLVSTSNALSMMLALDAFGNDSGSWVPLKTERDGFWPPSGSGGLERRNIGGDAFWKGLLVNVTVCKDGCDYKTVQAAVDRGIPVGSGGGRFVVHIKAGIYKEIVRIGFEHRNLVFIGDGMGKTVITGSLKAGIMGISTYSTAIVGVLGDGFMAYGLTFENTAGPPTSQAVAFRSDSDLSYIENCEFLGNQDTLYAHSLRQLYKSCRIEGNVDFIFGNSAAVFLECTILVRPRQLKPEKGEKNAITAQGRTDPAQSTGFSFLNCVVNGTEEYMKLYHSKPSVHKNFLGRPWKEYSRTVFIRCNFEEIVNPKGWFPFRPGFALKTLYYGEYGNVGPGAGLDQRVPWSSSIPPEHVGVYYIDNFIQGDEFSIPGSFSLQ